MGLAVLVLAKFLDVIALKNGWVIKMGKMLMTFFFRTRLYFLTRDMRNAKTLDRVEKTLGKIKERGLVPDVSFMEIAEGKWEAYVDSLEKEAEK